jgi:hypothetical protein
MRQTRLPFVEMWVDISAEQRDKRCTPGREPWITNRWPVRELGMSRQGCERWLLEHRGRVVFTSTGVACVELVLWQDGTIGQVRCASASLRPNSDRRSGQ